MIPWRMVVVSILVAAAALWGWGNRAGRYQVAPTGSGFVVLDTSTGVHWVYEQRFKLTPDYGQSVYKLADSDAGVGFYRRLVPPSE